MGSVAKDFLALALLYKTDEDIFEKLDFTIKQTKDICYSIAMRKYIEKIDKTFPVTLERRSYVMMIFDDYSVLIKSSGDPLIMLAFDSMEELNNRYHVKFFKDGRPEDMYEEKNNGTR